MMIRKRLKNLFARENPTMPEIGATGTPIFSGVLVDTEYLPDLQGEKGLEVFNKMRKSDGQVKGALLACELPYHSAFWDVKPASNSAQDKMIAEFIKENLFEGMTITWRDFLHHVLLMLPFGFSLFEKVFELRDGLYRWRKLAPRLQTTITAWNPDSTGGLAGVEQSAYHNGNYVTTPIPVDKLLLFTNEREGSNFAGTSLLRAAYKHWYYKNTLYAIDGIAAERHGVGVAHFTYPNNASPDGKTKIKQVGERLHAHERAYVALPEDYKFELKGVAGQLHNILGSIEHHDLQIARSILAQFINLGSKEVGSLALSQDQSGFFLMALQAVGGNITDTINRYAIRQLVDYNWDVKGKYPKLTVSDLDNYDVARIADALVKLMTAGAILPDELIEAELRRRMNLPNMDAAKERREKPEPEPPAAPAQPEQEEETEQASEKLRLFEPRRALIGDEVHIAFADIKDRLDSVEERFVKAVSALQKRQITRMVNQVASFVESGDIEKITTVDVPFRADVADNFNDILVDLFEYGQEQVRNEQKKQATARGEKALKLAELPDKKAFLRVRALAMANILANKLRAAMAWEALHQIKEGIVDKPALVASLQEISDRDLRSTAKFSASEAFNLGRKEQAEIDKELIDHVTSSALLDDNTCEYCTSVDGKELTAAEAVGADEPPYANCEGEDRCRCVWVYTFKTEKR